MKTQQTRRIQTALFALLVAAAGPVLASEEGGEVVHHAGHEAHVANWWGLGAKYAETPALGWFFLTFLIFVAIIVLVARKPMTAYLESRAYDVKKAIEEAKSAKEAAEQKARDAEARLAALAGEIEQLKRDFESQGAAESKRLEQVGHETAARIAKDAEDTIGAETARAQQVLRQEAARIALALAEQRIQASLGSADEARLQKALIDDLTNDKPRAQA